MVVQDSFKRKKEKTKEGKKQDWQRVRAEERGGGGGGGKETVYMVNWLTQR